MGGLLAELARWVVDVVQSLGYVGVFVVVLLGSLYLPVPTEFTLPLFGFLVGQGRLSFLPVVLAGAAARVSAAVFFYSLGLRIGETRLRRMIARAERTKLVYGSDLDRASAAFQRHGGTAILAGHLIPGVGALISIPAGLKRMPVRWRFLGYTILGSTTWTATLVGLGWALGRRWQVVEVYASFVGLALLAALVIGASWFLWRRWRAHR